jgi:pimeloyl-ACP methyl ester carboxylesterase
VELEQAFPKQRTIRVGGVETYVAEAGDGPPILLLHGNPDTHAVWGPVVARLAARHRCLAPDLPGFGRSRAPADFDCSLRNHSAFVRDLLTALELPRVHLVVHDVGGPYGLAFASEHPERVLTLTIFNTNFFPDLRWHFWARVWRTRVLGELAMGIANRPMFVREMRRGSPRMPKAYAVHAYRAFRWRNKRMVLRWYRAMEPALYAGWDERLIEATAKTPKRVLWGDLDPFLPASTAERYGGEVTHLPDCGHWVMLEEPEQAAAAIAELVATRPARPRTLSR